MGLFGPGWGWLAGGGWLGRLGAAAAMSAAGSSARHCPLEPPGAEAAAGSPPLWDWPAEAAW